MPKHIAVYARVSDSRQTIENQEPELKRWLSCYAEGAPVVWYRDKSSGRSFARPQWKLLEAALMRGEVAKIVVWSLDRLGRNAAQMHQLFDTFRDLKIGFVSLKEGLDLETDIGRLLAGVLTSIAQWESERRGARVKAGFARCQADGSMAKWKKRGQKPGVRRTPPEKIRRVQAMVEGGIPIARVARDQMMDPETIYSMIAEYGWNYAWKLPPRTRERMRSGYQQWRAREVAETRREERRQERRHFAAAATEMQALFLDELGEDE